MQGPYERGVMADYACNLVARRSHGSAAAGAVMRWAATQDLVDRRFAYAIELDADRGAKRKGSAQPDKAVRSSRKRWARFLQTLETAQAVARRSKPSLLQRNLDMLAQRFGLHPLEQRIFRFIARYRCPTGQVYSLTDLLTQKHVCDPITAAARMLRTTPETILRHTVPGTRLIECGLVGYEENPMPTELPFTVSRRLIAGCNLPNADCEALLARLVGKPCRASLAWDDYDHIGGDRDFAAALLAGASARREKGVNILVYGPPGTGKTEFCKTVAARLGLRLHAIADDDGQGGEPSRSERVAQIRLSESALAGDGNAVLLFDEMEDLLSPDGGPPVSLGRAGAGGSKVFLNRLLEQNRVPVFWTCNRIDSFDPALLRRMTFAIEIKGPHAAACERILAKTLAREGVAVAPDEVRRIAREFAPAPAIAASAAKAARLGGGGSENVRHAMRATQKAMRGGADSPPLPVVEAGYDPRLVAADLDLADLADRLCRAGAARNFSLCLHGAPGTGKSAFARHLAERLGLEVIHKRASDLISCWVGESEKNIAGAFAEARDAGAFLIFDEADSFLQERANAVRTWEVRQVNEMLTWMECHDQPFACTTNLIEAFDRATLRRFTFKIRLRYLDAAQVAEAFRLFFGCEAPRAARRLTVLTPGDFAVVARKARFLGAEGDADRLAGMLAEECVAKPDRPRAMGFAAG